MTPKCVQTIVDLERSEAFEDLSHEQLLLAAIADSSVEDIQWLITETDWTKWVQLKKELDDRRD